MKDSLSSTAPSNFSLWHPTSAQHHLPPCPQEKAGGYKRKHFASDHAPAAANAPGVIRAITDIPKPALKFSAGAAAKAGANAVPTSGVYAPADVAAAAPVAEDAAAAGPIPGPARPREIVDSDANKTAAARIKALMASRKPGTAAAPAAADTEGECAASGSGHQRVGERCQCDGSVISTMTVETVATGVGTLCLAFSFLHPSIRMHILQKRI